MTSSKATTVEESTTKSDGGTTLAPIDVTTMTSIGEKVTISYYNSDSWSKVYIFAYVDDNGAQKIAGDWPGTEVTESNDGWYSYTVEALPSSHPLSLIFNNGADIQTPILVVNDTTKTYLVNATNGACASKEEALKVLEDEKKSNKLNIYFLNDGHWGSTVGIYAYGKINGLNNEPLGTWGNKTMVKGEDSWYSISIDVNVDSYDEESLNIIIYDKNFNQAFPSDEISQRVEINVKNNADLYVSSLGNGKATKDEIIALSQSMISEEKTVIYFYNSDIWSRVSAYAWGTLNTAKNEPLGTWDNHYLAIMGDDGWYAIVIKASYSDFDDGKINLIIYDKNSDTTRTGDVSLSINGNIYMAKDGHIETTKEALIAYLSK